MLVGGAQLEGPAQLGIESDGHDLGRARADARAAAHLELCRVVAALGLLGQALDELVPPDGG